MRMAMSADRRAVLSAGFTLFLAVVGSAILPVPYAFRVSGLGLALALTASVWLINVYTSVLLVRSCRYTAALELKDVGMENLAAEAFGERYRTAMQLSLCVLLFGNMCGSFSVLKEVGVSTVRRFAGGSPAGWEAALLADGGWRVLLLLVAAMIMPLCLLRRMRQLEAAAGVGVGVLFVLSGYIVFRSLESGMPGLTPRPDLDYNPWLDVSRRTPQALGVLGFAFYLQPMLLPMLRELPAGARGRRILERAVTFTLGLTLLVYVLVGFFAVAHFGAHTRGNVLENIRGGWAPALDVLVSVYLAVGVPPTQFSLRCTIEDMTVGTGAPFSLLRHVAETVAAVAGAFLVAAFAPPDGSAIIFSITGATGVCLACYVMPILIYLRFCDRHRRRQRGGAGAGGAAAGELDAAAAAKGGEDDAGFEVPLLPQQLAHSLGGGAGGAAAGCWGECREKVVPYFVMVAGVVCSVLALWGSLVAL